MALQSCFVYWAPKVQNATIGDEVEQGVILIDKNFEGSGVAQYITLNIENYGEIQYKNAIVGSQDNPYAIASVEDFVEWFGTNLGTYLYVNMVKDINFNDSEEYKFKYNIPTNATSNRNYFNGLNYSIKNLIFTELPSNFMIFRQGEVKNLTFENLILIGVTGSGSGLFTPNSNSIVKNVRIGAFLFDSQIYFIFGYANNSSVVTLSFEDCTFNLKGTISSTTISFNPSIVNYNRCWLNFDFITSLSNSSAIITARNQYFNNTYITGIIHTKNDPGVARTLVNGLYFNSSYIALKLDGLNVNDNNKYKLVFATPSSSVYSFFCVMDKDGNDISSQLEAEPSGANLHVLSLEQAKDPNYLLSQGFPVGAIEEEG